MAYAPLILLAAGGTGGHLFPAEAVGEVLMARGYRIRLATDARAEQYSTLFSHEMIDVIPSDTVRGRDPLALVRTALRLGRGTLEALRLIRRHRPAAVVGFGGYPTLPPLMAARLRGVPTIIHDANAVLGRANRLLSGGATAIATAFPGLFDRQPALAAKTTVTGNPLRATVRSAAAMAYEPPQQDGAFRILVIGGSQGARIMADVVPPAMAMLGKEMGARLILTQQVREEDRSRVGAAYYEAAITPELSPFFTNLPARIAESHVVIARAGAGTVAELAAIGRPAILVPLPGAIDQDQFANAGVLETAGGAIRIVQSDFSPKRLAQELRALAADPARLAAMAQAARSIGSLDAAERLADLVIGVIRQKH